MAPRFLEKVKDLKKQIAKVKADVAKTGSLWVFQHIQKTAGTSLVAEIRERMKLKFVNIYLKPDEYDGYTHERFDESIRRRAEQIQNPALQVVTGHFMRMHMDTIQSLRPTKLFTFVREPVSRVVSAYRYQRSPVHPLHEQFKAEFPTFMDYVESDQSQNSVAKAICSDYACSDLDASLNRFEFIGTAERYPLSFRLMSAFLDYPRFPHFHSNKTETTGDNDVELTTDIREAVLRLNAADAYIHEKVVATLERLRPQILALETPAEEPAAASA